MNLTAFRDELKEKPDAVRQYARIIQKSIGFHRHWVDRIADAIVWNSIVHGKERGRV